MSYSVIIIPYHCIIMSFSEIQMQYYHSTIHKWTLMYSILKVPYPNYIFTYSNPITDF